MDHSNGNLKNIQDSIESTIKRYKQTLTDHSLTSKEESEALCKKIENLEAELNKLKRKALPNKNDEANAEALFINTIELRNQFEAGQEREVLFLITLLQVDENWAQQENESSEKDQTHTKKEECEISPKNCLCHLLIKQLNDRLNLWSKNEVMDPITKFMKSQGVIDNYEFKLLAINPDASDELKIPAVIHDEIDSLNNHLNNVFHSEAPVDKDDARSVKADHCKCKGSTYPHCCKLKSNQANKFKLNSIVCDMVLSRLDDIHDMEKGTDPEDHHYVKYIPIDIQSVSDTSLNEYNIETATEEIVDNVGIIRNNLNEDQRDEKQHAKEKHAESHQDKDQYAEDQSIDDNVDKTNNTSKSSISSIESVHEHEVGQETEFIESDLNRVQHLEEDKSFESAPLPQTPDKNKESPIDIIMDNNKIIENKDKIDAVGEKKIDQPEISLIEKVSEVSMEKLSEEKFVKVTPKEVKIEKGKLEEGELEEGELEEGELEEGELEEGELEEGEFEKKKVKEEKPSEEKPLEEKSVEEKSMEEKTKEEKPKEEKPVEEKPVKEKPVEEKPKEEKSNEKEHEKEKREEKKPDTEKSEEEKSEKENPLHESPDESVTHAQVEKEPENKFDTNKPKSKSLLNPETSEKISFVDFKSSSDSCLYVSAFQK